MAAMEEMRSVGFQTLHSITLVVGLSPIQVVTTNSLLYFVGGVHNCFHLQDDSIHIYCVCGLRYTKCTTCESQSFVAAEPVSALATSE
jgi:hypothetical protein